MAAVDFITLLGRVLQDGALRDAFQADANAFVRHSALREEDRTSFVRLVPAELEAQARVLLRKRFDLVRRLLPETCRKMGRDAWFEFERYGRSAAPARAAEVARDAAAFSEHLRATHATALCLPEHNRARFVSAHRRLALHLVSVTPRNRTRRWGVQLLVRQRATRWRELMLFLGG
ncbi:MAG: hypothetical protein ABIO94_00860 [Opitutaceae bacterium]